MKRASERTGGVLIKEKGFLQRGGNVHDQANGEDKTRSIQKYHKVARSMEML